MKPADTPVFILAAGRGERMRPLTDDTPKPLLEVGGRSLIGHHLERLAAAGFQDVVINHAWLGDRIISTVGDGSSLGLRICYSDESNGALETLGGIVHALPLLTAEHFICLNSDIWTDFNPSRLLDEPLDRLARLVMVDNPPQHAGGDFHAGPGGLLSERENDPRLTFSGIALYRRDAFTGLEPVARPLAPLLREWISSQQVEYLHHDGVWEDIGTPGRLARLRQSLQ